MQVLLKIFTSFVVQQGVACRASQKSHFVYFYFSPLFLFMGQHSEQYKKQVQPLFYRLASPYFSASVIQDSLNCRTNMVILFSLSFSQLLAYAITPCSWRCWFVLSNITSYTLKNVIERNLIKQYFQISYIFFS